MDKFDVIVIGGGPAGYKATLKLAAAGKNICLIDKNEKSFGGTCLNEGCIPVKSLLKSATVYSDIKNSEKYGIKSTVKTPDLHDLIDIMKSNTESLNIGLNMMLKKAKVHFIFGTASFKTDRIINVMTDSETVCIEADHILIATGSTVKSLPNVKIDGKYICSSKELLLNKEIPEKLLIVGGGVIGCEFASFYNVLGTEVTIVEPMKELLPTEDIDTGKGLQKEFKKKKIKIMTETLLEEVKIVNNKVVATLSGKKNIIDSFDKVLISVGRKAAIDRLHLDNAGVEVENGCIKTNAYLQTNISHIYAAGDVLDTMMLAHTAYDEGILAAKNILGIKTLLETDAIPRVVFSIPQVAGVGLTEKELDDNANIQIYKTFFKSNGKALIDAHNEGHVKIIVDNNTDKILGAAIIGQYATELIHELTLAVKNRLTANDLKATVHGHPTLSETIWETIQQT